MRYLCSLFLAVFILFLKTSLVLSATEVPEEDGFAKLSDLVIVFANITSVIATFAGFAVLFMLIRGGVAFITAQGDPKALQGARGTITWAVIGLIVILSAYIIISIVLGFVQIPGIGRFCLPVAGSDTATFCQTTQ